MGSSLPAVEEDTVVKEVNELRTRYQREAEPGSPEALRRLAGWIADSALLGAQPAARALVEDLAGATDTPQLAATKRHINSRADNTVLSVFSAAYFPTLGLDYLEYETIPSDPVLMNRYPSPTMPVNLVRHSVGFDSRVVVALFPENHIDGSQEPNDLIFYFIDKFVARHRLTRRLIDAAMVQDSFPLLSSVGDAGVERAAGSWVRLHEFHHRTGSMPIPQFLAAKSYKPLAGLEEMRVDVKSMLVCLNDTDIDRELAALTFEFVLAERLLRYSVEGIPKPNYDAIASQLLFNYLREQGGLTMDEGRIRLLPTLPEALTALVGEITELEDVVLTEGVETARAGLIDFTRRYTRYDAEKREFLHVPFFAELKERLGV
ncbi:DUF6421 family protein [Micromonospora peucetia]|uniref:DUF6421 family protein n=1 Tax=Micromonospora peucetia TaxID=47871 RepID=UPI00225A44C8|nr:DUF6421 family protein [Micromonospora peucetia]MCX4387785.1 DUF6421 family protein [Micromonospora peucetia]